MFLRSMTDVLPGPPAGRLVLLYPNNNPLVRSQSQAGKTHKKPKTTKVASVPWTEADDKRLEDMVQRTVRRACGVSEQHATAARVRACMRRPPLNLKTLTRNPKPVADEPPGQGRYRLGPDSERYGRTYLAPVP